MEKRIRNNRLQLRLSYEEKEYAAKKLQETNIRSYSDLFMRAITNSKIIVIDTIPILALSEQISKIGNNINQIARVANTTSNIYENDVKELQEHIKNIQNLINKVFITVLNQQRGDQ